MHLLGLPLDTFLPFLEPCIFWQYSILVLLYFKILFKYIIAGKIENVLKFYFLEYHLPIFFYILRMLQININMKIVLVNRQTFSFKKCPNLKKNRFANFKIHCYKCIIITILRPLHIIIVRRWRSSDTDYKKCKIEYEIKM